MTTDELLAVLRIVAHGVAGDTDAVCRRAHELAKQLESTEYWGKGGNLDPRKEHAKLIRRAATVTQGTDWIKRLRIEELQGQEPNR